MRTVGLKKRLAVALAWAGLAAFGGAVAGYFDAWVDHRWDAGDGPWDGPWYDVCAFPGVPGELIVQHVFWHREGWGASEAWLYRRRIAFWNAAVWAVPAAAIAFSFIGLKKRLAVALASVGLAALIGAAAGFFGAWIDHAREMSNDPESRWYDIVLLPGLPGHLLAQQVVLDGADWQGGEAWLCRRQIVFWNATVWAVPAVAVAFGFLCFAPGSRASKP